MIAAAVGVSDKTVGKVRAELEAGAEIPHHETRTGSDGVKQPATKPDPADTPTGSIFDIGDALTKMQVPDRRKAVAELSKEGLSTRKIGEVLGVSKDTVHDDQRATVGNPTPKAKKVAKKADPPVENPTPPDLTATAKTQTRKQRENKAAAKRQDKARREAAVVEVPAAEIREGKLKQALADVADVDLVFTDPPYPREFLSAWSDLADWAVGALKPGALLVAYSGQYHLPDVMERLSRRLDYQWLGWLATRGQHVAVHQRPIMSGGKPLLIFSNGPLTEPFRSRRFFDSIGSEGRTRELQSVEPQVLIDWIHKTRAEHVCIAATTRPSALKAA